MPKKSKLIEPIPATFDEVVDAIFADYPKPRDPEKKIKKEGDLSRQPLPKTPKTQKSQSGD